ncbi:MAG: hypothetical protein QY330_00545 [Candidatus Dojkabacteria bacterium]|uniref:Cell division protein FtsL n=2 Tax=Candidatus Dojkabacteria TaxID=74243 RepID=A0A136KHC3_9BACT|nr:MAG: hypothetical protein UZ20_WS6002000697 [candidate division WS6 bacterium OLB21]MBW7953671.1 hypothetical protein [Candidatus Dojkabacteria bacterium]WKZ28083.1 MAG: hypothetical protein QY330_00545 [Candidatus Dojkabacteria bacterium]
MKEKIQNLSKSGSLATRLIFTLVALFIIIQLYVLSSVGTQGEKVKYLRDMQAQVKIENEILRASIANLQSSQEISKTASEHLRMQPAQVVYIDLGQYNISAQR